MTNTSSPRTFSWISTKTSMSAKRCTVALVSSTRSDAAMASARGRLLLPASSFIEAASVRGAAGEERARYLPSGARQVNVRREAIGAVPA